GRFDDDGTSSATRVVPVTPATEGRRPIAAGIGRGGRFVEPVDPRPERTGLAALRRREPAGEPQVAEQDDQRDDECRDTEPDGREHPRPEDAVEADAGVPEGVGPQVETDTEQEDHPEDDKEDERDAHPPAEPRRATPAAVVRATRRAPSPPTATALVDALRLLDGFPGSVVRGFVPGALVVRTRFGPSGVAVVAGVAVVVAVVPRLTALSRRTRILPAR